MTWILAYIAAVQTFIAYYLVVRDLR